MLGNYSKLLGTCIVVLLAQSQFGFAGAVNSRDSDQSTCYTLEKKDPIPFSAFSNINPKTKKPYQKNDLITIPKPGGEIRISALAYLNQLNALERELNTQGYSLRDKTIPSRAIANCQTKLNVVDIDNTEFSDYTFVDEITWAQRSRMSSFRMASRFANTPAKEVELPKIPNLDAEPVVKIDKAKLEAKYDRSWLFEYGTPEEFYTSINPYITVKANSLEAVGQAGVKWQGGILGQWQGEFAHVWARAQTPGSGAMRADIEMTALDGKRVWAKPIFETKPLALGDRYAQALSKGVTYRFMVGPIPFKAEVGVRGEAGFKWQVKLFPLQAAAYAAPWVGADVYAQIGGDIVAAGGGVSGRLIFLKDFLVVSASASFEKAKEFQAHLVADVSHDMEALKGELFAFAYIYYPNLENLVGLDRWGTEIPLYSYEGYTFKNTLFNFDEIYELGPIKL